MFAPAYLDHNASSPLQAEVLEQMMPFLQQRCGNPSSRHEYGRQTRLAIDLAGQQVAAAVNAHPTEVIFTSGGSEANNLFLKGAAANFRPGVLALSQIEHPCVREPARQLKQQGWRVHPIAVNHCGTVDPADFEQALALQPRLIAVMLANNETGVIQPIAELAGQARASRRWFHCDAVQALGKLPLDFRALGVHGLSLSGHKIGGPIGAGALIVDKRVELSPLIAGGGQERGLRSGTENVAAIVGFGAACALAQQQLAANQQRYIQLQSHLEQGLRQLGAIIFAENSSRLPNTCFFSFPGLEGETLVGKLDRMGFAVASGSACSSANPEPSATLLAMGVARDIARGAVRVSFGPNNTLNDVDGLLIALQQLVNELKRLTAMSA